MVGDTPANVMDDLGGSSGCHRFFPWNQRRLGWFLQGHGIRARRLAFVPVASLLPLGSKPSLPCFAVLEAEVCQRFSCCTVRFSQ